MPTKAHRSTSLRSVTIPISITGGTATVWITLLLWLHHQSNLCGHSCSLHCWVRLYLTQFLSSDITFTARVYGCTCMKQLEIYKSLYNITA